MHTLGSTITSASLNRGRNAPTAIPRGPELVLSLHCDRPMLPPSRHVLAELDEVRFGRGEGATGAGSAPGSIATRDGRVLVLRIADPRMSSEHGRIVRRGDAWHLDDPTSKNGSVLNGALARAGALRDGDVLELGHTFFVFRVAASAPGAPDLSADELTAPTPELATFAGELAAGYARLTRVAPTDVPVLVVGDTGTGKEVVARALHALSGRSGPFVAVNCGALPETLVEAELFGARRGAFSGAVADRVGLVRSADGGTLFLDEIAELRPSSQAALLRVLQEREVLPIGDTRAIKVDVRFCAATHRDLKDMVARGTFRDDLYARLLGFTLELPPLRSRREDLGLVMRTLLARRGITATTPIAFTPAAARVLHGYDWPHNIREVERWLSSAVALADRRAIDVGDFPAQAAREPAPPTARLDGDDVLRAKLVALLTEHRGNIAAVARVLKKDRMQIHRWVKRFALELEAFRK